MIRKIQLSPFTTEVRHHTPLRLFVLLLSTLVWWLGQYQLLPLTQVYLNNLRSRFPSGYETLASHFFSNTLPVLAVVLVAFVLYTKLKIIPKPNIRVKPASLLKESFLWGVLISLPVIVAVLYMGISFDFSPNIQKMIASLFDNSYEEIVYRLFLLLVGIYTFKSAPMAIIYSSILYAAIYTQYPPIIQATIFLGGIGLSLAYLRTNSILTALMAHQVADMLLNIVLPTF